MSGIAGIFHLDQRQAAPQHLARMTDQLSHRGPDGVGHWCDSSTGLAHLLHRSTPESPADLPLTDSSGLLTITADVRLDNRDELIRILGLRDRPAEQIDDSALLLASYKKWGRDCTERLLGAFAFAIWDASRRELFCARDHVGVKPFYYCHLPHQLFAFGSEPKALLVLDEVPQRINKERVGDYLASICSNNEYTFFKDIQRLPPAHTLTVNEKDLRSRRYWSLDPHHELHLESDAEYAATFRELFEDAVRCRLRSHTRPSAYLSGGLDSSSIACVSAELLDARSEGPLDTFSAVYDEFPDCDERPYIQAVLEEKNIRGHFLDASVQHPVTAIEKLLQVQDEPFSMPNVSATLQRCQAVSQTGMTTVLDGHGGDEVVSHGRYRTKDLARAGRWIQVVRELHGLSRIHEESLASLLWDHIQDYGLPPALKRIGLLRLPRRVWNALRRRLIREDSKATSGSLLQDVFIQQVHLKSRYEEAMRRSAATAESQREYHYRTLVTPGQPLALELLDQCSAAFGIETRYPFWDRRLVSFCLAAPADQKLNNGWSRVMLRRAMANTLPDKVRWRRDKTDFSSTLKQGLLKQDREKLDAIFHDELDAIKAYVNPKIARDLHARFVSATGSISTRELFMLQKMIALIFWMKKLTNQPSYSGSLVRR